MGIVLGPVWTPCAIPPIISHGSFSDLGVVSSQHVPTSSLLNPCGTLCRPLVLSVQCPLLWAPSCALELPRHLQTLSSISWTQGICQTLLGVPLSAHGLKSLSPNLYPIFLGLLFFTARGPVSWKPLFCMFSYLFCCYCSRREDKFRPCCSILARWGSNRPSFNHIIWYWEDHL